MGEASASQPQVAMIACVRCTKSNPDSRRFCNECGTCLFQTCPECSNECAIDETFCGQCGGDIRSWLQEQQSQIDEACQSATVLREANDFEEALKVLSKAMRREHPALHAATEHAALMYDQICVLRDQSRDEASSLVEKATDHENAKRYVEAFAALKQIPSSLQNGEIRDRIQSLTDDVTRLKEKRAGICQAVAAKETLGLLPRVLDYLREQPNDKQFESLAKQLIEQIKRRSKKLAGAQRFQEAYASLCSIPQELRSASVAKSIEQLQEPAYLFDCFQSSPIADTTLESVSKRLQKIAGSNKSVVQRSAQLVQRREKAKETGVRQLWAGAPETQFGVPVELTNDASGFDDSVARKNDAYRANPDRFHVAIGLALQGIGKAAINTNLIPKSGGIKEKLGRFWKAKKTQAEVAWGIDYDALQVRLIGLELGEEGAVKVSECRSVQIGSAPKSEESSSELVDAIQAIVDELPLADQRICIGIPGVSVLARFMEIPKSSKDKVESAIRFESKHHIPFSLDETVWDYHLLNEIDEDDEEQISLPVALVAVKEPLVVERLAPFEEVGLQVSSVQSCVTALYNWAFHHINSRPDEDDDGDSVVALLDVRYDNSSFIVVGKDIFWSRSWFRGVKECRSAVASALAVNAGTAETALREPHRLPSLSQLAIALEPFYENTNREIAMSISKVKASYPYESIDRIAITGLGSEVHGLIPFLRRGHLPFRKQFNGV